MNSEVLPYLAAGCFGLAFAIYIWFLTHENRRLDREKGVLERRLKDFSTQLSQTVQDTEYSVLASEHAPDGIIVQDMLGRILWSNPAFRSIHGREHADIVGKHTLKFAVPADVMPKLTSC